MRETKAGLGRAAAAIFICCLLGVALALAARALGAPVWLAVAVALAALAGAGALARKLPAALDEAARTHPALAAIGCAVALAAVAQTARLAVFMDDARRTPYSVLPWDTFWREHSCLSAYMAAADRERRGEANIYDEDNAAYVRYHTAWAPLDIDGYLYPPTFLPLPLATGANPSDFFTIRRGWFAIELLLLVLAPLAVARFIGGPAGLRAGLLAGALCAATPFLLTLQLGNVQLASYLLAMWALVAIESGRSALGGTLLGILAAGKVFPGVLAVVLLARRRWRGLGWMAGAAAAMVVISVAMVRIETFRVFVDYELPRLSHGDLFFAGLPAALEIRFAAVNFAVFGLVAKLRQLGVPGLAPMVADVLTWLFTVVVTVLAWRAAARATSRLALVQIGLAALILAATRSPFVPSAYGTLGALWLLTLLAAGTGSSRRVAACVAAFVALTYVVPDAHVGFPAPPVRLAIGLVQQLAVFALAFGVLIVWSSARAPLAPANEPDPRASRQPHRPAASTPR